MTMGSSTFARGTVAGATLGPAKTNTRQVTATLKSAQMAPIATETANYTDFKENRYTELNTIQQMSRTQMNASKAHHFKTKRKNPVSQGYKKKVADTAPAFR